MLRATRMGSDEPAAAEVVHETARTRVTRLRVPGGTLIRKEPLGGDAERRLEHEEAMLERLRGVAGVAQLRSEPRYAGSLVLDDAGATTLAGCAAPLPIDELVPIAVALARAVAQMHRRGVMHCDITPENVVMSADGAPCLVDFALASPLGEIRPQFTATGDIGGNLSYLAPEQTGRMARSVDQRADLYALGATLYELAIGEPPFGSGDPLTLVHDLLARMPVPPADRNPAVPQRFSDIVLHLLEKEPDNRYQTAEGLIFDLERLLDPAAAAPERIGTHDVPLRLLAPPRLVARDDEVASLQAAFDDMLAGRCRGVLVTGAGGTGKTALVDELRDVVAGRDGWFVAGKFDQYRRDLEFDGLFQAFRALGRMLLAEPEEALADARERMLEVVGPNAGQLGAAVPELAALLGVAPEPGDPLTAQVRLQRAAVEALRVLASPRRPVVLFVDDFQWAGRPALGVVDLLVNDEPVDGLLLVVAHREDDPDAIPPVAAALSRWRGQPDVRHLPLGNLSRSASLAMVAETLHADPDTAIGLIELIEPHTGGNPHETLELLNALRREGILTAAPGGWVWDQRAAPARLSRSDAARLMTARIDALPAASRQLVEAMACLAGRVDLEVLETAVGESGGAVQQRLAPAVEDGVVLVEVAAREGVRFRHDRIREVVLRGMSPGSRRALGLSIARRLAPIPELTAVAAEQYLPVVDDVDDAGERASVVELLRRAADQGAMTGDYVAVEALLDAALRLADPDDAAKQLVLRTRRHAALYGLGRLDEADEEYRAILALTPPPAVHAEATALQVRSLTHRMQLPDALGLGLESLRQLGIDAPPDERLEEALDDQLGHLRRWLARDEQEDVDRPEMTDPVLIGASHLLNGLQSPAYFVGNRVLAAWLGFEALRIWLDHGPGRTLIGPASTAPYNAIVQRGDDAGYEALRRLLTVGDARGWEPGTSQARYLYSTVACWVEPLADATRIGQQARVGLIAGGDFSNAAYTYFTTTSYLFICGTVDDYLAEVEAGIAFARRMGNDQTADWLEGYRWLAGVLRGERDPAQTLLTDQYAGNALSHLNARFPRVIIAAIFGDREALEEHSAAVMPLLPGIEGTYMTAQMRLMRGLAVADRARAAAGEQRAAALAELDELTGWLAECAARSPENYLAAVRLLEAERAWATGDVLAAVVAFDAARREVATRPLPAHRPLISERAARFLLAHGAEHGGHELLAQARAEYLAWGAPAKARQLDAAYPSLRPAGPVGAGRGGEPALESRTTVSSGTLDLLSILSASQALSSETSMERLHARLVDAVRSLTGATGVQLVLWSEDRGDWQLLGEHEAAPLSLLRYARRTGEPVVVADAATDERFARDPYFADGTSRSVLAVPIVSRGTLRGVLVLENRLLRGAFASERLDTVKLLAGQLAVSLDNAQLYAGYQLIADEQAALRRVATLVARGVTPDVVFAAVADEAGALFGADGTAVVRLESDGEVTVLGGRGFEPADPGSRARPGPSSLTAAVQASGDATRVDVQDAASEILPPGIVSAVASPIVVDGRVWGVMSVGSRRDRLPQDTEQRLAQFTELVATAIANAESRAELAASRARIVSAADQARRRIERDLHDGAQQRLVALELWLRGAQGNVPAELEELAADLGRAINEAAGAAQEVRELAHGIHPANLAKGGLRPALKALARRAPIVVDVEFGDVGRLPEPVEISAYYIVSEALNNVAKHARASTAVVAVDLDADNGLLHLAVTDDGIGGADLTAGTGLLGVKDRAEALGGRIELDRGPGGQGTTLRAQLPVDAQLPLPS